MLTFRFDVKTLALVVGAVFYLISQHGNVNPISWMPVRIVVAFFGTLISKPSTTRILTSIYTCVLALEVLTSKKETCCEERFFNILQMSGGDCRTYTPLILFFTVLNTKSCFQAIRENVLTYCIIGRLVGKDMVSNS